MQLVIPYIIQDLGYGYMNKAEELFKKVSKEIRKRKGFFNSPWLKKAQRHDAFDKGLRQYEDHVPFYQWLACAIKVTKPKFVCEFGADIGGSACFILSELGRDARLYSIDQKGFDDEMWRMVPAWEDRIDKLPKTNDTSFNTYPRDFPWNEIMFWFIDSDHNADHVGILMDKIRDYIKPGMVIVNHDVDIFGIGDRIKEYPWDYCEDKKIFSQGFGVHVI